MESKVPVTYGHYAGSLRWPFASGQFEANARCGRVAAPVFQQ
jgi:hypothetical protein